MTAEDLKIIRTFIGMWDCVNDRPLTTPGPDSLYKSSPGSIQHTKEYLDAERLVSTAIREQWKEEKVSPEWMTKLLIHIYRHGYQPCQFKLYEDPSKGYIPQGLIALGYDAETLVRARLRAFRVRLLKKIDSQIRMAS
jgi:hypothetical protein